MATNGVWSYAIFTYRCGSLNWVQARPAGIGLAVGQNFYVNHNLSLESNVNDIACLKQNISEWSNVVYLVGAQDICLYAKLADIELCQNGGKCITTDNGSSYRCSCPLFYTGYNCEGLCMPN